MQNVEMKMDGDMLIIKVDTSKRYDKSKSGKTTIIASTGGNVFIPDSTTVKIGLNIYEK